MNDLLTARASFLDKVNNYAPGEAIRFTAPLDEVIRWSETNELVFTESKAKELVKFSVPGARAAFWCAAPRTLDGAKFTLLGDASFSETLRAAARDELARIDGRALLTEGAPTLAFTKLIWEPYRTRVLNLMARLLDGVRRTAVEASV